MCLRERETRLQRDSSGRASQSLGAEGPSPSLASSSTLLGTQRRTAARPVWEATQHLIRALLDEGEPAAADLVARLGGLADVARDLAYRLYVISERKGWTDEARAYNALVVAWPELTRLAEAERQAPAAQGTLGLGG